MTLKEKGLSFFLVLSILSTVAISVKSCIAVREANIERDKATQAALIQHGFTPATPATPKEIIKLVPVPKEVIKLVERKEFIPVTGATIEAPPQTVYIPCSDTTTVPVNVGIKGNLLIGITKLGKPYWAGDLFATISGDKWQKDVRWDKEDVKVSVLFNDDLERAIARGNQSFFRRHLRVSCPSIAITYGLIHRQFDIGPSCNFGWAW